MKNRWTSLPLSYRVMLCLQLFLIALFLVLYVTLGSQKVLRYGGTLFHYRDENGVTTYTGSRDGEKDVITVSPDPDRGWPAVEFRQGDTLYGPYSIVEDPSAISDVLDMGGDLTGVEIRSNGRVVFRGAFFPYADSVSLLYNEDGGVHFTFGGSSEPDAARILYFARGAGCVRRGSWGMFALAVFVCAVNVFSICFVDLLFRFKLRFRIRNAENAEPSEWELMSRWIAWVILMIVALAFFIAGLNAPNIT